MPRRLWVVGTGVALAMAAMPPAARAEGFAIALDGGYYDMTNASQSAKAVFDGSSGGFTFGAFLRMALGLDQSWFVGAGGRTFSKEGERVFVADPDSPPFPLGHPLKVRVTPLYALVGYRLSPDSAFRPYLGVGPGLTLYKEESSVAGESFDQSASKVSFHGVLGAEYGRGKIRFGIEGMYTTAPNTLGEEGVSQVYDETDAGGFSAVGRIIIAF